MNEINLENLILQGKFVLSTEKTDSPQRTHRTQRKTLMLFLCVLCGEKGFVFMDCRHELSSVAAQFAWDS
ncbi:MAG: hypothetical protein WC091_18365 [Sulfuricellaceae bacterium]